MPTRAAGRSFARATSFHPDELLPLGEHDRALRRTDAWKLIVRRSQEGLRVLVGAALVPRERTLHFREIPGWEVEVDDDAAALLEQLDALRRPAPSQLAQAIATLHAAGIGDTDAAKLAGLAVRQDAFHLRRLAASPLAVRLAVDAGRLSLGHLRPLLRLDGEAQVRWVGEVEMRGMTVAQLQAELHGHGVPANGHGPDADIARLQAVLSAHLGAEVTIKHRRDKSGSLRIDYADLECLEGVLAKLDLPPM